MVKLAKGVMVGFILATALSALFGCATIAGGGGSENVTFQSAPDGADVILNGRPLGKTPFTVMLKRESNQILEFKKDGYKPISMSMTTDVNGWFFGNILIGGLIGSTTDGMTGAITKYSPNQYFVTLTPVGSTFRETDVELMRFAVVNYQGLLVDISKGEGEYLNAYLAIGKADDAALATIRLKALLASPLDPPEFARAAAKALYNN